MHPRCLHSHHRVRLAHRHSGGHAEEVPQPHLLHPLLPKPFHAVALAGHGRGVPGHAALHRGVEQRGRAACARKREGKEGRVKQTERNRAWWLTRTYRLVFAQLKQMNTVMLFCFHPFFKSLTSTQMLRLLIFDIFITGNKTPREDHTSLAKSVT